MNIKCNLVLLKGEDKTLNVESIKYCRDGGKWEVYFQKNPQRYMYSYNDVEKLSQPQEVDLSNIRFEYQGTLFYNLEQVLKFGSYFRLFFKGGASKLLHESELNIKKSCLKNKKACQFMDFFTELSEEISIRSDEGNSLLGKQYEKIDFIGEDTVLAAYLEPEKYFLKKYTETPLIFPFGCNDSQKKAVQMTMQNQVSIIQGPPGTGKTQTILNVAVSRAVNKLRLVVSDNEYNNNTNIGDLVRYILYEKGEVVEGKVYSVFDLLYKEYAEVRMAYLKEKRGVSAEESENLFYYFIQEVMEHEQIVDLDISVHVPVRELIRDFEGFTEAEVRYALRRGTHVDFLLFRKVDKTPIFAIEVDGYSYHKKGTKQGDINDKLKDSIFEKVGVPLVRFVTVESGEDVKLRKMLQKYR